MSSHKPSFGHRKSAEPLKQALPRTPKEPKCYLQRRLEPFRTPQLKKVKLIYNNGFCTIDALLRDISENGAKIQTDDALHLPDRFIMKCTYENLEKTCHRVWRKGDFIGVKFTP